jgi:hypothetical protein
MTSTTNKPDPTDPERLISELRKNKLSFAKFADRMVRAVYGKSRYGVAAERSRFDTLVSKSQEAFTLLLYKNGHSNWVWASHNDPGTTSDASSEAIGESGCPSYRYTARSNEMTFRNGGWSREGMQDFNELYMRVAEDRVSDNGTFEEYYKMHRAKNTQTPKNRSKRKRDNAQPILTIRDDLGDLLRDNENSDNGIL